MLRHKNFFGSFYNKKFTGPQTCYRSGLLSNFEGVYPLECNICQKIFVRMEIGDKNVGIDLKTSLSKALRIEIKQSKNYDILEFDGFYVHHTPL